MNTNEDLRARHVKVLGDFASAYDASSENGQALRAAIAALARQEEEREAVYQCRPKAFAPWTDCDLETYNRLPRDQYDVRILYRHPAPQAAGVSDAYRELMEVRAGLCTLGVMGPGETAAEALQRYVTRCTAAGAAPEGWVLVPREPTKAMVNAARRFSVPGYCIAAEQWPAVYRAMLAAAQQPGAQHGQEGRDGN